MKITIYKHSHRFALKRQEDHRSWTVKFQAHQIQILDQILGLRYPHVVVFVAVVVAVVVGRAGPGNLDLQISYLENQNMNMKKNG